MRLMAAQVEQPASRSFCDADLLIQRESETQRCEGFAIAADISKAADVDHAARIVLAAAPSACNLIRRFG